MSRKVLSTKSLSPELVEMAEACGLSLQQQDFIEIFPILTEEKRMEVEQALNNKPDSAIVFTSANAVRAVKELLGPKAGEAIESRELFSMSGKTAEQLKILFENATIVTSAKRSEVLAGKMVEQGIEELLFFCGNIRREEIPARLKGAQVELKEIVVYETRMSPKALAADFDGILFFSPSAVRSYFSVNKPSPATVFFAIGPTTAAEIKNYHSGEVKHCDDPSAEKLLELVCAHFKTRRKTDE